MTKTLIDIDTIPRTRNKSGEAVSALTEAIALEPGKALLYGFDSKGDATRFAKAAMVNRKRHAQFQAVRVSLADMQVSLSL